MVQHQLEKLFSITAEIKSEENQVGKPGQVSLTQLIETKREQCWQMLLDGVAVEK